MIFTVAIFSLSALIVESFCIWIENSLSNVLIFIVISVELLSIFSSKFSLVFVNK